MKKISDIMMTKTNIRSTLAIMITLLSFGIIYRAGWDREITTEDMGLISSVTPILAFILGYYFGSNKDYTDNGGSYNSPCPDCGKNKLTKGKDGELIG